MKKNTKTTVKKNKADGYQWQLAYVLKHKNEYEKAERKKRKQELEDLRNDGIFRVALNKELGIIRTLLEDPSISCVDIEVNPDHLANFHGSLDGYEEMKEFVITNIENDATKFRFRRKEIDI